MPRRLSSLFLAFLMLRLTLAKISTKYKRSFGEQLNIRHGSYSNPAREEPLPYPPSNYYDEEEVRPPPSKLSLEEDVYPSDLAEGSKASGAHSFLNGFKEQLVRQELWGDTEQRGVALIRDYQTTFYQQLKTPFELLFYTYLYGCRRSTPFSIKQESSTGGVFERHTAMPFKEAKRRIDTAKCFSCMSKFYEAVWPALASVYKRPMNFTDKCNEDILETTSVPVTHCPTICVGMWEEITVGGVKIRGHIRGCMDDLLHNGFNQTIVAWYRWMARDSCREYRKRELFKLGVGQSDESSIHLCTCYADHCNHAASPSAASCLSGATTSLVCLTLLLAFLLSSFNCHTAEEYRVVGHAQHLDDCKSVCEYDVEAVELQPMDSWRKRKRRERPSGKKLPLIYASDIQRNCV